MALFESDVLESFLTTSYFGNTGWEYFFAAAVFLVTLAVLQLFRLYIVTVLERLAAKTQTHWDDLIIEALQGVSWRGYSWIALFIALKFLTFHNLVEQLLQGLILVFVVYYVVKFVHRFIGLAAQREASRRKEGEGQSSFVLILGRIAQGVVWVIAFLLVLANFGVEITPLIASLGVGGIAIAFALQNILEDLFSSFSIYFDKPFEEGDYIVIGADSGTVEHIGLKTTRIRTLQGEQLVVSNRELTSTRINNYKRMKERRVSFSIGVEYGTTNAKLKKAGAIIAAAVSSTPHCRLDRQHFKAFGDFALIFEVVYYVDTRDYTTFMDCQQEINFKIKEGFSKAKIEMAFPTQTIHLKKG
ncbi:mechanosensitive ion channel family protein [Candidatus Woesearchaeota archaeon]|nr:MAG: mechanosensitive ion channel family protein [Candidatus Woesearchaeota archaeon]